MKSSVFPAEACEILGGVACDVETFPETKPKEANTASSKQKVTTTINSQTLDREYLQYDSPKTVFIAEACDDLGGEFCEPAYQYQSD
ncbi:putative light regulated Lir1 [Helianthus annuus]|nr:putative light regulated Lir1 [Helianthus annuus]KAJ0634271.1 putative light regulated Lir1 [Helianthus annuus]